MATFAGLAAEGLLLAMRPIAAAGAADGAVSWNYAGPYVRAVQRQAQAVGHGDRGTFRQVALQSGGQVEAMIGVHDRTEVSGGMSEALPGTTGRDSRIVGGVEWRHAMFPDVELMPSGDAVAERLFPQSGNRLCGLARSGLILAVRAVMGRQGGDWRFPREVLEFESRRATADPDDRTEGKKGSYIGSLKTEDAGRNELIQLLQARFLASMCRAAVGGYVPVRAVAHRLRVVRQVVYRYGISERVRRGGVPLATFTEGGVQWSRPAPAMESLGGGIFEPPFDRPWPQAGFVRRRDV